MLASICIRRQKVADWCRAWLVIKANMKQMGLHGERRTVTGMIWMQILFASLCSAKKDKNFSD